MSKKLTTRVFDQEVSEDEYTKAPLPTDTDVAMLAYCLGSFAAVEFPILRNLRVTQMVTANPRLHYILSQMIVGFEKDILHSLAEGFSCHPDLLPEQFIACMNNPEEMAYTLLAFSEKNKINPMHELAMQVGRPMQTREITCHLARAYKARKLGGEEPTFADMLRRIKPLTIQSLSRSLIDNLLAELAKDESISNAFYALMDQNFDYFYMNLVDGADEILHRPELAFRLLATS